MRLLVFLGNILMKRHMLKKGTIYLLSVGLMQTCVMPAFAEETTASMEELNSTINVMSDTAKDLKNISDDIAEAMTFFKL